jgi:AcrR family transcriptional regulator
MPRKLQVVDSKRRIPRQGRAQATVELIFEATARILQRGGRAVLNTNAVAEHAGISIGTLYQYFPNKEAILVAMARRLLESDRLAVMKALSGALDDPGTQAARIAINRLIDLSRTNQKVRRIITQTHVAQGFGDELARPVQEITQMLAARADRILPRRTEPISPVTLFVLTRAVVGVIRAAAHEESPFLSTAEFEDELVRLVEGFLAALDQ